jgi:hypothetical protein
MNTVVVSSNWTLFFKLLLPVFWGVFWGSCAFMFWVAMPTDENPGTMSPLSIKILISSFFLTSTGLIYYLFGSLKRVEFAEDFFYVTNYFKTYRYTYDSIETIEDGKKFMGFQPAAILLKEKSSFGKSIPLLATDKLYTFLKENDSILNSISTD